MGHTWREMYPAEAETRDNFINRLLKLRKEVAHVSLSEFTVSDFEALYRVMGIGRDLLDGPEEEHLEQLEKRLEEIRSRE